MLKKSICIITTLILAFSLSLSSLAEERELSGFYFGDVDFSGEVNSSDARTILRAAVGLEDLDADARLLADMDNDTFITASDARLALRTAVALEDKLIYHTHDYGDWQAKKKDDICLGTHIKVCATCGKILEENCEADMSNLIESTEATCTAPATNYYPCKVCGGKLAITTGEAKGHTVDSYNIGLTTGINCSVCGQIAVPSFNNLVNSLKSSDNTYAGFSKTVSTFKKPTYTGMFAGIGEDGHILPGALYSMRLLLDKELKSSLGTTTEYTELKDYTKITKYNFPIEGTSLVSLLSESNIKSITTTKVSGIDFLSSLPDSYTATDKKTYNLKTLKAATAGELYKVSVVLNQESYKALKDNGGSDGIKKIFSASYGSMIDETLSSLSMSGFDDFVKMDGDAISDCTIIYYFNSDWQPVAAHYCTTMAMSTTMNMYIDENDDIQSKPTASMTMNIDNEMVSYYFFNGLVTVK